MDHPQHLPRPDWVKRRVLLVDPNLWTTYRRAGIETVFDQLQEAFTTLGVSAHVLSRDDKPIDIWIRDYGFVENTFFQFAPSYARDIYKPAAIESARKRIVTFTGGEFQTSDLILDGGNLVHDGRVAILTDKYLRDNACIPRREVEEAILRLGFENVVFIPAEPGDTLGHADGVLRFIAPGLLLMNDYAGSELEGYGRAVLSRLKVLNGIEIVPFPWKGTNMKHQGIWSAEGCYVNLATTAGTVVFPTFGHCYDERAFQALSKVYSGTVIPVPASALAKFGGVLGCVTLPF